LKQTRYQKLEKSNYESHSKQFTPAKRKELISEWEIHTGQNWPKYEADVYHAGTGNLVAPKGTNYQAHHINPQQLGGKHEWWNIHPVHVGQHQSGIHGANSILNQLLKSMN